MDSRPALQRYNGTGDDSGKTKIQMIAFGCALLLMVLLGVKLFNVERASDHYERFFATTIDKIKALSSVVITMEQVISEQKTQDIEIKTELFIRLNKRVKILEKILSTQSEGELNGAEAKPKQQMTVFERIKQLEDNMREQTALLNFLQNNAKQIVRQQKIQKFNQIAKGDYFKPQKRRNPWILERNNIKTPFMDTMQLLKIEAELKKEEERLEPIYHMSQYTTELPFCIVVPSYNNAKNFRYEFNLQSIFNQDYDNYRVVIVDDASTDNTTALIRHFMKRNKNHESKVVLVTNKKQMTAVPNINMAITKHCRSNQIGFFVDGDDELVGKKVFKVFNAIYQSKKPAVAYSISLQYWVYDNFVKDGWSAIYTDEQKALNKYRDVPQKISHLRSFRIDLYLQIKERDLKDKNGDWFKSTYDQVICLPMLEMSCGNIVYIDDYFYLYVYGTGFNDRLIDSTLQWSIANYVKTKMPKYSCNRKYGTPLPLPAKVANANAKVQKKEEKKEEKKDQKKKEEKKQVKKQQKKQQKKVEKKEQKKEEKKQQKKKGN